MTSTEGQCQMWDLLGVGMTMAQSLASVFTTQLWAHTLSTTQQPRRCQSSGWQGNLAWVQLFASWKISIPNRWSKH